MPISVRYCEHCEVYLYNCGMTLAPVTKAPPAIRIGDRARVARREMGLRQPGFVELLREHLPSLNEKTYSSWEAGRNPDNIVEVAEALQAVTGYPWTWFLRGVYADPSGPGGPVTGRYRRNKSHNWGRGVAPERGNFGRTIFEEGSGTQSKKAA